MPGRYVFDCETDGLLPTLTKLHCLGIKCLDTGRTWSLKGDEILGGLAVLSCADLIVGHNIIDFDLRALKKVYPNWNTKALVRDTMVLTRLMWPHIKEDDHHRHRGPFPKELVKPHSLAAWGYRLGNRKGDFKGPWDVWSQEMQDYMDQDVSVTFDLWKRIEKEADAWGVPLTDPNPQPGKDCVELEHRVAAICIKIEEHGFRFSMERALALTAKLTARRTELVEELHKAFPPEIVKTVFIPKANNKKFGYVKGVPFTKEKTIVFNPASRQQVAARLQKLGWKPSEFGKDGTPTVDDEILSKLKFPQAKLLAEFFLIEKRLGQIANGKEAWFRHERNGRIHGRIASGGAHTGRMTHSNPNMAQVPGNHAPYGEECRDCFIADEGYVLVGCDADALELRDLAGYMATWDGGAYIETVLKGDKSKGTDMHTLNAKAIGCSRDDAKVFFYAMIYGAGDAKLGETLKKGAAAGRVARANLMQGVPALGALVKAVHNRVETKGFLVGLDGRRLKARAKNAALNTLLQSAGAVQMKRGLVILWDALIAKGWEFGREFALVGLIHDEWQANVRPELADEYGQIAAQSIRDAGTYYSFKCPLDGQYQKGASWKDTH
jgi:DNA polymerase-1